MPNIALETFRTATAGIGPSTRNERRYQNALRRLLATPTSAKAGSAMSISPGTTTLWSKLRGAAAIEPSPICQVPSSEITRRPADSAAAADKRPPTTVRPATIRQTERVRDACMVSSLGMWYWGGKTLPEGTGYSPLWTAATQGFSRWLTPGRLPNPWNRKGIQAIAMPKGTVPFSRRSSLFPRQRLLRRENRDSPP